MAETNEKSVIQDFISGNTNSKDFAIVEKRLLMPNKKHNVLYERRYINHPNKIPIAFKVGICGKFIVNRSDYYFKDVLNKTIPKKDIIWKFRTDDFNKFLSDFEDGLAFVRFDHLKKKFSLVREK